MRTPDAGQAASRPARASLRLCRRGGRLPAPTPPPAQAVRKNVLPGWPQHLLPRRLRGGRATLRGCVPVDRGREPDEEGAERQVSDCEPLVEADLASRVLERALARGGDFAELFCEERRGFALSIDESRIERPQSGSERGAGIRVIDGEVTRFAHVDGLGEDELLRAAEVLAQALAGEVVAPAALRAAEPPELQEIEVDPASVPAERKAEVLRELD